MGEEEGSFMKKCFVMLAASIAVLASGCDKGSDGGGDCDLMAPECNADEVCLAKADDSGGVCTAQCDPAAVDACEDGQSCDAVQGGGFACFAPIFFEGTITDSADGMPITDATVLAADATGIVVTEVVRTAADGSYELRIPVVRDAYGDPVDGTFTLRVGADDYLPFPYGIRPALPIDATTATFDDDASRWTVSNATTSPNLIALDPEDMGRASISGHVAGASGGALVVAERADCGGVPCPYAYADLNGDYVIFNVPAAADYTMRAYKAGLQVEPLPTVVEAADLTGVDLAESTNPLATISGSVNIVNPESGTATSVVLAPKSTFFQISDTFIRAEIAPGLRAPEPGIAPNITGAYSIAGIPEGTYEVLAGFENDFLIRDPDPNIAGTQIVELTVPDPVSGVDIAIDNSFKITGSVDIVSPGANGPEAVTEGSTVELEWADDAGEDHYEIIAYDAFGEVAWDTTIAPKNATSITYGGELEVGMYYQWRVISIALAGNPISTSEELRGVFYVVPAAAP
jgi:hypothetical protein